MSSSSSSRAISLGVCPSTVKRLGSSAGLDITWHTLRPPHVGLEVLAQHCGHPPGGLSPTHLKVFMSHSKSEKPYDRRLHYILLYYNKLYFIIFLTSTRSMRAFYIFPSSWMYSRVWSSALKPAWKYFTMTCMISCASGEKISLPTPSPSKLAPKITRRQVCRPLKTSTRCPSHRSPSEIPFPAVSGAKSASKGHPRHIRRPSPAASAASRPSWR